MPQSSPPSNKRGRPNTVEVDQHVEAMKELVNVTAVAEKFGVTKQAIHANITRRGFIRGYMFEGVFYASKRHSS